jgi:predicted ATPase
MVKTIKIENFKSIQSLEIELGRVNVFIGENGCGKTNILEAITMGSAAAANKLDNEFLANRGIRVTEPKYMKSGFEKENEEKDIFVYFKNDGKIVDFILFNQKISGKWLDKTQENWEKIAKIITENVLLGNHLKSLNDNLKPFNFQFPFNTGNLVEISELINLYLGKSGLKDQKEFSLEQLIQIMTPLMEEQLIDLFMLIIKEMNLDSFQIFTPENYILRKYESDSLTENLGVNGEGLLKMLEKLYKENKLDEIKENLALIDWFDDFEIVNDAFRGSYLRIKDQFLNEEMTYSSFKSVNEGFLFLLFYFTLFISEYTPKFFAIDNIDNALNPRLCQKLIEVLVKLAKKHDKQVIMTTHNPSILDGLNLNDDEQRLFAIYRNADGHTKARRILKPEVPNGVEPARMSELFLRGAIGGVPKNF